MKGRSLSFRRTGLPAARAQVVAAAVAAAALALVAVAPVAAAEDAAPAQPAPAAQEAGPALPTSADAAKQAWLDAARRSETFNEQVLAADAAVTAAQAEAATKASAVQSAAAATAAADQQVSAADAVVARYQSEVSAFANASYRGARLDELSALLTAGSPEDYLDKASSLAVIAADQRETLDQALVARQAATTARAQAQAAQDEAQRAQDAADAATAAAAAARADLDTQQAALHAEITSYQLAYAQLSSSDVNAAAAAAEAAATAANASSDSATRQSQQAAQRSRAGIVGDDLADATAPADTGADFSVWAAQHAPSTQAGIAVTAALSRQGLPYVWGAVGPDTFDCSGLMLWAWQQAGVTIPRNSAAQADGLRQIPLEQLQPGDLVTFYSPVSHVGMYVGDGKVLHASMPGVPIKVVPLAAAGPNPTGHAVNR